MSAMFSLEPIRIGVVANEPMRLEGLTSIFENHAKPGETPLLPIVGTLEEHLDNDSIEYVLIDWSSSSKEAGRSGRHSAQASQTFAWWLSVPTATSRS